MSERIRILIVDDSALYRLLIGDVLQSLPHCAVVGNAKDGQQALDKIDELNPDLVTLDVEMPVMSGIDVLREMNRRRCKTKALMVSRFTDAGAQTTTDALLEGAFDFILKPSGKSPAENKATLRRELDGKIAAFCEGHFAPQPRSAQAETSSPDSWKCDAVLIGTSTGGPEALRQLLPKLPADLPVPVIVVQHMPAQFTGPLADRLDRLSALEVVEAKQDMRLERGRVFLAPGGRQLKLGAQGDQVVINITDDPSEHNCRPTVDYTLRSACKLLEGRVLAVILTGMGRDGWQSTNVLKQQGGRVVAQHADGCTVFGMPKAVIEDGLADRVITLPNMPSVICDEVRRACPWWSGR